MTGANHRDGYVKSSRRLFYVIAKVRKMDGNLVINEGVKSLVCSSLLKSIARYLVAKL